MATFKLKDNRTENGIVIGVGIYHDGILENAPDDFENPNFEPVETPVAQDSPVDVEQPSEGDAQ